MRYFMNRTLTLIALLGCVYLAVGGVGGASGTDTNNVNFGFTGPETYPIDNFIGQLRAADLDGDGLTDLIVVNNSRSKINILYNQTGKTNRTAVSPRRVKLELNEIGRASCR